MTLGVKGGYEAAIRFYDALKLITRLVNLGDAKSLACHPASTTHRQMSPEEQRKAGVLPEMIRLSIGIEHIDDIIADLDQALDASDAGRNEGRDPKAVLFDEKPNGCIKIGLINNMSDEGLKATERQFISLLDSASGNTPVHLSSQAAGSSPQ